MTFFDSLKKWFYTRNSSAASSDARVPLLDASGNPKGSDTMANLASVLGGQYSAELKSYQGSILHTQQESVTGVGFYQVSGNSSSSVLTDDGVLFVTPSYRVKIAIDEASYAVKLSSASQWRIFPEFYKDYANLGALASALGVAMIGENESINIDTITGLRFLNTTNMGTYWTPSASLPGSSDRRNTYALLISVKIPNSISGFQVAIHYDENKMYFRTMASGNWTTWIAV